MTIFILEDNYYTADDLQNEVDYTINRVRSRPVNFIVANSIYEANEKLKDVVQSDEQCNDLGYVIVDLNMNPMGLPSDELLKTNGGVLTGWVWVENNILNNTKLNHVKIIFYSAFVDRLRNDESYQQYKKKKKLLLINKEADDAIEQLERSIVIES